MGPTAQIVAAFSILKCLHLMILFLLPTQFDILSAVLLETFLFEKSLLCHFSTPYAAFNRLLGAVTRLLLTRVVDNLVVWDAVYFADLFVHDPLYEHQFVFCPLWWRLVALIPEYKGAVFYPRLVCATAIANLSHLAAALMLYRTTLLIFQNARVFSPRRMALCLLVLYVMTPAAAFMTAPYSEPMASILSFMCIYVRQLGLNASPGVFAALAYGFRANCLLLGILYLIDVMRIRPFPSFAPLIAGLVLGLAFFLTQYSSYAAICINPERGEWCNSRLPLLFAYAQAHYWNNGFLNYWTHNNIPNFLFGAPSIILSLISVRYFCEVYPVDRVLPILAVNTVFICLLITMWHVQIVTRIHLFLPVNYWLVAGLLTQPNKKHRQWGRLCVGYFVIWGVVQVSLFGAFLPPA
ncbi:mannosyltransferase [Metschnikowia bicuspidata]|uniref:GPI mannosyltransferase 2 n=1 Tax=Metschnikowia bicuspidata TaxID=27322 RepID=A0A4P9ZDM8_9ASCO|nr:mannosyltransferase [Metschnikowia bicuspidata]